MSYEEAKPEVKQKYFEKSLQAAKSGFLEAMNEVAKCYLIARGVEKNDFEAIKWLQKAVDEGDISAAFVLGKIYCDGKFILTLDDFNIEDACRVGIIYCDDDDFVIKDVEKAIYYLSKAADKNHIGAIEMLALVYKAQNDFGKMFKCYQKGANLGNGECIRKVADCYLNGRGVQQDDLKALEWYIKAVELYSSGNPTNNQDLLLVTKIYNKHFKFSDKKFVNYYYVTTEKQGKLNAIFGIASELYKTDKYRALKWYKLAANMGDLDAAVAVSYITKKDVEIGISSNYYEALKWYEKATEFGDINAAKNLFLMCRDGHKGPGGGPSPNIEKSTYWLEKVLELSKGGSINE